MAAPGTFNDPTNPYKSVAGATVAGGANVDLLADQQHGLRPRPAPSSTVLQSSVDGNPGLQAMDDNPGFKALHASLSRNGGGGMHLSVPPAPVGRYPGGGSGVGSGGGGGGFEAKTTPQDLEARDWQSAQRIGNKDGKMAKPSPQENWGLGSNPDMGSTSAWHDLNPDGPSAFGAPNNHPTVTPSPADFNNRIGFEPSRPSAYGPDGLPGMPATPQEAALLPKSAYGSEGLHTSIVGDPQSDGLPNPELVESAGPIRVTPLKNMSGHQALLALARLPHYAEGSLDGGDETDDFADDSSSSDSVPPPAPVFYDGDEEQGTAAEEQDNPDFHPMVSPQALASVPRSDDDTADMGYETAHPNFHPMVDPRVLAALQAGVSGQGATVDGTSNTNTPLTVDQGSTAENFRPLGGPSRSDPESVWHQAMAGEGNSRPLGSPPDGDWSSFHTDDRALGVGLDNGSETVGAQRDALSESPPPAHAASKAPSTAPVPPAPPATPTPQGGSDPKRTHPPGGPFSQEIPPSNFDSETFNSIYDNSETARALYNYVRSKGFDLYVLPPGGVAKFNGGQAIATERPSLHAIAVDTFGDKPSGSKIDWIHATAPFHEMVHIVQLGIDEDKRTHTQTVPPELRKIIEAVSYSDDPKGIDADRQARRVQNNIISEYIWNTKHRNPEQSEDERTNYVGTDQFPMWTLMGHDYPSSMLRKTPMRERPFPSAPRSPSTSPSNHP